GFGHAVTPPSRVREATNGAAIPFRPRSARRLRLAARPLLSPMTLELLPKWQSPCPGLPAGTRLFLVFLPGQAPQLLQLLTVAQGARDGGERVQQRVERCRRRVHAARARQHLVGVRHLRGVVTHGPKALVILAFGLSENTFPRVILAHQVDDAARVLLL